MALLCSGVSKWYQVSLEMILQRCVVVENHQDLASEELLWLHAPIILQAILFYHVGEKATIVQLAWEVVSELKLSYGTQICQNSTVALK
jgi:hypothetical protein